MRALYTRTRSEGFGPEVQRRILLGTYALSAGYYDAYYLTAQRARTRIRREYAGRRSRAATCMLMPATPTLPFRLGEKTEDPLAMYLSDIFTIGANLAGIPGLTRAAAGLSRGGLPRRGPAAGARGRGAGAAARRRARSRCAATPRGSDRAPRDGVRMAYEAVIGLECHIQLNTRSKMFCGCPAAFGARAQHATCARCASGCPGALPRANRAAIDAALRLGPGARLRRSGARACSRARTTSIRTCRRTTRSPSTTGRCARAARCRCGRRRATRAFALTRIHVEEDTGKSFHPERHGDRRVSRVDFNRAGVPLLELVTEPVFRDAAECGAFLTALRRLVRWLGISDGDMEKGQLRCDANVSLRPAGRDGARHQDRDQEPELDHAAWRRGIAAEIARQRGVLEAGGAIEQATLLYDADHDALAVMRTKEHAHDYRYFPEPDLPLLVGRRRRGSTTARARLPELPWARARAVRATQYGLPAYDAAVLTEQRELADYYEACAPGGDAQAGEQLGDDRGAAGAEGARAGRSRTGAQRVPAAAARATSSARVGAEGAAGPARQAGVRLDGRRGRRRRRAARAPRRPGPGLGPTSCCRWCAR